MSVFRSQGFEWVDVVAPSSAELADLARQHGLHPAQVQDCLDPEHLPKFERAGSMQFMILRGYDDAAPADGDTIQELTRKIAIFYSPELVLTIHRTEQPRLAAIRGRWSEGRGSESPHEGVAQLASSVESPALQIVSQIVESVLFSYEVPIVSAMKELDELELSVFSAPGSRPFDIQFAYLLKRRASVVRRLLRLSVDLLPRALGIFEQHSMVIQDLRETGEHLLFLSDDLSEGSNNLLQMHLSLASHRTNEVMRVLTIFSVFLLPLTVITGIYGMNFSNMPELAHPWGYPFALLAMLGVALSVFFWFRRKGWMK